MQVKIIIGTISFMLTMILLGFYTLLEESRLANFTTARLGRQIEAGGALYDNNCVGCHGINGNGTNGGVGCVHPDTGEDICLGLPLNSYGLVCGTRTARMDARGWSGSKEDFINSTLAMGRAGGVMPTWSQAYGGPLQENEIRNLTKYVLNYESEELCDVVPFNFPWPADYAGLSDVTDADIVLEPGQEFDTTQLPISLTGDPARGETLYLETYVCSSCHGNPADASTAGGSGPWHGDYAEVVVSRIGESNIDGDYTFANAEDYTYRSILYPSEYIVDSYPGPPSAMPMFSTDQRMNTTPQDIVDLTAYLLQSR